MLCNYIRSDFDSKQSSSADKQVRSSSAYITFPSKLRSPRLRRRSQATILIFENVPVVARYLLSQAKTKAGVRAVTTPLPTGQRVEQQHGPALLRFDGAVKALLVPPVTARQTRRPVGGAGEVNTGPF